MSLPDLIEIVPLKAQTKATITVPGSKSITNRALILAALADGETVLKGALWSEDTQVMVECLQELGYMVNVGGDPHEPCNRTITVYGKSGDVPSGGSEDQPLELFVGNAGTAARFLAAFVCLGRGVYRLHGVERMHQRPQAALFAALRSLGYRVDASNDRLPATIHTAGPRPGKCQVSIEESSQFASALLLCASVAGWQVTVSGQDSEEASYVAMTSKMVEVFPKSGGAFQVEPDASSGSYFIAANRLGLNPAEAGKHETEISVVNWPQSGWQIDEKFPAILAEFDLEDRAVAVQAQSTFPGQKATESHRAHELVLSRKTDLGDSIMTAIVIVPLAAEPPAVVRFTDLGRLRVQECERVFALRTELMKCGVKVIESGDTLEVFPSAMHGAEIETYNDHRMAMCFAILGLKVPGIRIKNPSCVKKTFPNFFQKVAEPPPTGLGVGILDARTKRALRFEELFAD
jgi:3-phosphoshikimate 1-carboxyvinyltransferase